MRDSLKDVKPYRPPKTEGLGLQSNTNRLGAHPINGRLGELLETIQLNHYPDNETRALRHALGDLYGLDPAYLMITNGSNEAYDLIFKTFLNPGDEVAYPSPSFSMYPYYAKANAVVPREVPLDDRFDLDAEAMLAVGAPLAVLCSPNNPTGNTLHVDAVEAVIKGRGLVAIDEAYGEFADQHWINRIGEFQNLLVTRTFSKAYGLAGLRIGYIAGNPELIEQILKAKLPYNVNALGQALAATAVGEQGFVDEYTAMIRTQRPRWSAALAARGFEVYPSLANFVLARVPDGVARDGLIEGLTGAGVIVRSSGGHPRLRDCVRITIGTAEDGEALFTALDEVLS